MTVTNGGTRRNFIGAFIALLVTAAFVALFLQTMAADEFIDAFRSAPAASWGACLAATMAATLLRFIRLKTVYIELPLLALFRASTMHGAAVALLPGRVGEAALPLALKRMTGTSLMSGVGFLILVRLLDAAVLALIAAVAFAFAGVNLFGKLPPSMIVLISALGLGLLAGVVLGFRYGPLRGAAGNGGLADLIREFADASARLSPLRFTLIVVETLGVWTMLAIGAWTAVYGAGLNAAPAPVAAAMAAGSFAFVSPVNGVASLGPFEAAFAGALALFGYTPEPALAAAAMLHLCAIITAVAAMAAGQALGAGRVEAREPVQCSNN